MATRTIAGTVKLDGVPTQAKLLLLESETGELRQVGESDAQSGAYSFSSDDSVVAVGDPEWANVAARLTFDDGFKDLSKNSLTVGTAGSPVLDAVAKFGGSSLNMVSATDYVYLAPGATFSYGTGDFTIEFWFYTFASQLSYAYLLQQAFPTSLYMGIRFGDTGFGNRLMISMDFNVVNSCYCCSATKTSLLNTWTHIAFQRKNGQCELYLNGTKQSLAQGTSTNYNATSFAATQNVVGNTWFGLGQDFKGHIDDVRVTIGVARYSQNFTLTEAHPTHALRYEGAVTGDPLWDQVILAYRPVNTPWENLSESIALAARKDGPILTPSYVKHYARSAYFGGGETWLFAYTLLSDKLNFSTNVDFTIEAWVRQISNTGPYASLIATDSGSWNENAQAIFVRPDGVYFICYNASTRFPGSVSTTSFILDATALGQDVWHHIAVTRAGSVFRLFVDGALRATQTIPTAIVNFNYGGTNFLVGANGWDGGNSRFKGCIDSLRITRGTARYTAAFDPAEFEFGVAVATNYINAGEKFLLLCDYGDGVRPLAHGLIDPAVS